MGTEAETVKELKKIFVLAFKQNDFLERLSNNPTEELQKNKIKLTVDELFSHLPLMKHAEITGLQLQNMLNAEAKGVNAAMKVDPFGKFADRTILPQPGPPPPVQDVLPSPEAQMAQLAVAATHTAKSVTSGPGRKALLSRKKGSISRTTRKGRRH